MCRVQLLMAQSVLILQNKKNEHYACNNMKLSVDCLKILFQKAGINEDNQYP